MAEEKITLTELYRLFGGSIPPEVFELIFNGPDGMTVGEARTRITEMAREAETKRNADDAPFRLRVRAAWNRTIEEAPAIFGVTREEIGAADWDDDIPEQISRFMVQLMRTWEAMRDAPVPDYLT